MLKAEKDKGREEINRDRLEMVSILHGKIYIPRKERWESKCKNRVSV
jgi:hypothetical protein